MSSYRQAYARHMLDVARVCMVVSAAFLALSTAATGAFAILGAAFWLLSGQWRDAFDAVRHQPVAWLNLALFGALLAGVSWSLAPALQALDTLGKYRPLLFFAIVLFLFAEERWRARLLWSFAGGALVLLCLSTAIELGVYQIVDPRGFSSAQNATLYKSPITHGFIMSLVAYGAALLALRASGARRWGLAGVALLAAFNVWFAVQGRTGYVVLSMLVLWLGYARWSLRGLAGAAAVLVLALGAAYQWAPAFETRVSKAVEEAQDYRKQGQPGETSIGSRLHFWKRSAQWLAGHPLLGAGTGGWAEAFYQATEGDDPFMHNRARDHPHNEYVHMAVQLGPLGLALFVAMLVAGWRGAARLPVPYPDLARGFVLAFAIGCLFSDFLRDSTEGHLWALLGGALFSAGLRRESRA
jgi:O-antigen ligase